MATVSAWRRRVPTP
uniref:Uncharacterized protein n=1 Tax=Arundo donax TaxID=35708 RepID=A0A0A9FBJ3_ARUDO